MTDETKKHVAEDGVLPENGAEPLQDEAGTAAADETTGADGSFDNAEALLVLVEGLKGENADLKDRYLRLAADMDNLRRRTERDVKDAKSYAVAGFARDMLTVSDNLRRALDLLTTEQREAGDEGFKALIEGVEMTERAMLTTLERHGVRKQEPEGQKFDPNFHQAMFEVPNADVPNNTVIQVVQDGYVIGERVLRPAMVGVSKGGPKQAAEPQPDVAEVEAEAEAQPSAEAEASPAEAETALDEQANKDA